MLDCRSQTRRFVIPFTKSISRLPHKICPSRAPRLRKETPSLDQDHSARTVYSYRVCTAVRALVKISRINTSVNYGPSWVRNRWEKTIASPHQSLAFRARLCAKIRKIEAPLPSPCTAFSPDPRPSRSVTYPRSFKHTNDVDSFLSTTTAYIIRIYETNLIPNEIWK